VSLQASYQLRVAALLPACQPLPQLQVHAPHTIGHRVSPLRCLLPTSHPPPQLALTHPPLFFSPYPRELTRKDLLKRHLGRYVTMASNATRSDDPLATAAANNNTAATSKGAQVRAEGQVRVSNRHEAEYTLADWWWMWCVCV
jgi:hypothetical protein